MSTSKVNSNPAKKEKLNTSTKNTVEKTISMNINIAKSFRKKIKQKKLDEETTVTDIVTRALEEHLEK